MFIDFFYKLRETGLDVSVNEWLTVMEALKKNLCKSSLTEFYYVCRSIVVRSESEFDKFDTAFADYFKDIKKFDIIPQEIYDFLENPKELAEDFDKLAADLRNGNLTLEDLQRLLRERLEEQKERHDGGIYWVGTGGGSTMGHSGYSPKGIRVGGEGRLQSALQMAGEHNYKDFREDNILDTRQLQVAFRRLRQFSSRLDGPKTELNVEKTIEKTCDNAGRLKLVFERPRQNTVKLIVLFDSGGSMHRYSQMCSALFQAVSKSNHFKDLK
ncbi:MAG: VWA domain-containing protein, partial [Tyzzerella sp.]|nr:VWA domain-containing protein [Candidatus Fimicola merdigallinarum]